MAVEVKTPGLQTTVQDEGRIGLYAAGMPPSGAMDKASYRVATCSSATPTGSRRSRSRTSGPSWRSRTTRYRRDRRGDGAETQRRADLVLAVVHG